MRFQLVLAPHFDLDIINFVERSQNIDNITLAQPYLRATNFSIVLGVRNKSLLSCPWKYLLYILCHISVIYSYITNISVDHLWSGDYHYTVSHIKPINMQSS